MNQVARSNEHCHSDQSDTLCIDSRLANMNVSSIDTCDGIAISASHLHPREQSSFDHIVFSHRSGSIDIEEREDFEVPISQKLSMSFSQDYAFREVADSRDPEDDTAGTNHRVGNDERTASVKRNNQDIFISPSPGAQVGAYETHSTNSTSSLWASISSLKRANPIYESDAEYEDTDDSYSVSNRKRRCSIERLTTAVYWQHELKSADE